MDGGRGSRLALHFPDRLEWASEPRRAVPAPEGGRPVVVSHGRVRSESRMAEFRPPPGRPRSGHSRCYWPAEANGTSPGWASDLRQVKVVLRRPEPGPRSLLGESDGKHEAGSDCGSP